MSWQHWILATIYVINIVASPLLVGNVREYTKEYAAWASVIGVISLVLLVWGQ